MTRTTDRHRSRSWYLDPVVARQKAEVFLGFAERWRDPKAAGQTLKTDLFEEANGTDALVPGLERRWGLLGLDLDFDTARRARARLASAGTTLAVIVADMRKLGIRDGTFELVVSPSTLDHFATLDELLTALGEVHRVLKPGGIAVVILDNPLNPLYHPLRWLAPLMAPYPLGRTLSRRRLCAALEAIGFEIVGHDVAIHNPRGVLTLVNLLLRAVLGRFADRPIAGFLRACAVLDRLPTRGLTACFLAVGARKR